MKDRIVVATDFSQSSLASLAKAIYLAKFTHNKIPKPFKNIKISFLSNFIQKVLVIYYYET